MRIWIFSFLYRTSRYFITKLVFLLQKIFFYQKDLETAVKIGDKALGSLHIFKNLIYDFSIPKDSRVDIYDLTFSSPLVGASFKSDEKILEMWLKMGIGAVIFKTIMKDGRLGNPRPRLQEVNMPEGSGFINSLGLPGPGIKNYVHKVSQSKLWNYGRPIGISIGGDTSKEYINNISKIESSISNDNQLYFYELNISCPNTESGQTICEDPNSLNLLLSNLRNSVSKIISIKISPDVSDEVLNRIGEVCSCYDRIVINAGNTQYKTKGEIGLKNIELLMSGGGLSGPAIFHRTNQMVKLFSNFKMPIMATGGISSIDHINLLKESGASLFGMATSLILDPYSIPKFNRQL